jgi:F0F1-type ATP synthase membrane subunit a
MNWLELLEYAAKTYIWFFAILTVFEIISLLIVKTDDKNLKTSRFQSVLGWVLLFVSIKILTMI